jgi:DNA-binding protein Alba
VIKIEEKIFVGGKDISRYISACFFSLGKEKSITLVARGNNIKRAIDILAILVRDYIDNPEYKVKVGSEPFENRNVSTIEIVLSGTKKANLNKEKE